MTAYWVGIVNVRDQEPYLAEAVPAARAAFKAHGGVTIFTGEVRDSFEGTPRANRIAVVEFPSIEALRVWKQSEEVRHAREVAGKYSDLQGYIVEPTSHSAIAEDEEGEQAGEEKEKVPGLAQSASEEPTNL